MSIRFFNDGTTYRFPRKRAAAAWIAELIRMEGFRHGDISYIFCSPGRHLEINRTWLGHDYPTDVITFDYSDLDAGMVSGDIFIDPATVAENAVRYGVTREHEMLRVIAHGALHLCGYNDKTAKQQETIRAKEDKALLAVELLRICLHRSKLPFNSSSYKSHNSISQ